MRSERYVTPDNMDLRCSAWLEEIRSGTRPRPWLTVAPDRCALLVIDMLRHFAHPDGRSYLPATQAVVPGIMRLLQRWRELAAPVVFTAHSHGVSEDTGMLGKFFNDHIRRGEDDARIIDELAPLAGETVITKSTYDAFHGTGLQEHLRSVGADQVLVTGVLTQLCCETTARSAFVRGFEVYVAADATATATEDLHTGSLKGMASGVAVITSSTELIDDRG